MASIILTHDPEGEIQGLNDFKNLHPPVAPVFFSFRIMLGVGMLMLLFSFIACYQIFFKKQLPTWLLKMTVGMTFSGWIATLAGWYVTEIGRQPYLVTGILKTRDAVTQIAPENIGISLAIYLSLYAFLLIAYIRTLFVMANRAIKLEATNPSVTEMNTTEIHSIPHNVQGVEK